MVATTDEEILSLLLQKGARAFERGFRLLIEKYQERLYWHIRRIVLDHEDANDVVQNCFIKVYRGIEGFEGKSSLYTWLYRIATNEALSFLSKQKRSASEALNPSNAYDLAADPYFDGDALQLKLQKALQQLPEKQRLVFNMRYYDELPYGDISNILDTSVGALKASYHHAVKKIESFIRESGDY